MFSKLSFNLLLITTISFTIILSISINNIVVAIPIADQCPAHSQFNPCMTRCPITCSNYHNGPPECLTICQVGCECEPGFIKLTKNPWGPCVKQYECQLYTLNNNNNHKENQQQKRNTSSNQYLFNKFPLNKQKINKKINQKQNRSTTTTTTTAAAAVAENFDKINESK